MIAMTIHPDLVVLLLSAVFVGIQSARASFIGWPCLCRLGGMG